MNLKEAIQQGVDDNVVVYDSENNTGRLTIRLVLLMRSYAKEQDVELACIYVDDDAFPATEGNEFTPVVINGVIIYRCQELNCDGPLQSLYTDELHAKYPPQCTRIIIGLDINSRHVILGGA
jgi:hypothetical protein